MNDTNAGVAILGFDRSSRVVATLQPLTPALSP
jgi:hypothetical protein